MTTENLSTANNQDDEVDCRALKRRCDSLGQTLSDAVSRCRSISDPMARAACLERLAGLQDSLNACREDYAFFCGDPGPRPRRPAPPNLEIAGVEVTQSIQFFSIGGTGAGQDNALTLVEGKETLVRVFLTNKLDGARIVNGSILLEYRGGGHRVIAHEASCTVEGRATSARAPLAATLNFRIPAQDARGGPKLTVSAWFDGEENVAVSNARYAKGEVWFARRSRPTLAVYRIEYTSVNNNTVPPTETLHPPPSFADCQATFEEARRMFPLSGFSIVDSGSFSYTKGVATTGDWYGIHKLMQDIRSGAFPTPGADVIYVGMMRSVGGGWGFGEANTITSFAGDTEHFAHELGHILGCCHVSDSTCPIPDGSCAFPDYANTSRDSGIGETGVRIDAGITLRGADTPDIMSYCSSRWISPHHWRIAFSSPVLEPGSGSGSPVSGEPEEAASMAAKLVFTVRLHRGNRAELVQAWHQPGEASRIPGGTPMPGCVAELYDASGRCLDRVPLHSRESEAAGRNPYRECTEAIAWHESASELVIVEGDIECGRFAVTAKPPLDAGGMRLERAADGGYSMPALPATLRGIALRYSLDGAKTWHPLPPPELGRVHWDSLGSSEERGQYMVELLAADSGGGMRTVRIGAAPSAASQQETAGQGPRRPVHILTPTANQVIDRGATVALVGSVALRPGDDPASYSAFWSSNREGFLADGFVSSAILTKEGRHVLTLHVVSGLGDEMGASRVVEVRANETERQFRPSARAMPEPHRAGGCSCKG